MGEILENVKLQKGKVWAWVFEKELRYIRQLARLRELPKFDLMRSFALVRQALQEIGEELVARGRLEGADDVFYLKISDLGSELPLAETVRNSRVAYRKQHEIRAIPYFMANTRECLYGDSVPGSKKWLQGIAASPGEYEGTARVAGASRDAELKKGEVLVAYATDPTWTPLFLTAGALIMTTGGQLSHGGTVAREYGIPAVSGIEGATEKISTGDRVRVDGASGWVEIVPAGNKLDAPD